MSAQLALKLSSLDHLAGRRVIASISGGKDSAAMSLYLKEMDVAHDRVFMDTGWEHPATYEYLRGPLTKALGPIAEIRGDLDFLALVAKKGLFPSRVMRFCTQLLKVHPAIDAIGQLLDAHGDLVNAIGIRRAESQARSKMLEWEWSDGFDCEVWRPLIKWSVDDVRAIHARHGLELNPLYAMGASRVGCWPCIHARKSEIALVARIDPDRIEVIANMERRLNEAGRKREDALGRPFVERTMFSYHGGNNKHVPLPIHQAVEWANSKRGEWTPAGAGEACMRHGLCDSEPES